MDKCMDSEGERKWRVDSRVRADLYIIDLCKNGVKCGRTKDHMSRNLLSRTQICICVIL
jgi:hypothetical protein